jgi:hypothetical protein
MSVASVLERGGNVRDMDVLPERHLLREVYFDPYRDMTGEQVERLTRLSQEFLDAEEKSSSFLPVSKSRYLARLKILRPDIYEEMEFDPEPILNAYKFNVEMARKAGSESYNRFALAAISNALTIFSREEITRDPIDRNLIDRVVSDVSKDLEVSRMSDLDVLTYGSLFKLVAPDVFRSLNFPERIDAFSVMGRKGQGIDFKDEDLAQMRIVYYDLFNDVEIDRENTKDWKQVLLPTSQDEMLTVYIREYSDRAIISAPRLEFREGYVVPDFNPQPAIPTELVTMPEVGRHDL